MMGMIKLIHQDCDPTLADDKGLPTNSYLVKYNVEGTLTHDIVMANKAVDIFDEYYDKYKKDFLRFDQTEGRLRPNLYGNKQKTDDRKKRR